MTVSHQCYLCRATTTAQVLHVMTHAGFAVVTCPRCTMVFTIAWPNREGDHPPLLHPPPPAADEAEYWTEQAAAVEMALAPYHDAESDRYLRLLAQVGTSGHLLDVGCSIGLFVRRAQGRGFTATGIEASPGAARFAREQLGLDVRAGAVESVDLPLGAFDVLTLLDVIEHQLDPHQLLSRVRALLRPGGILVIETPEHDCLYRRIFAGYHRLNGLLSRLTGGRWDKPWPGYYGYNPDHVWQAGHVLHFTERTLVALLAQHGFSPLVVERQFTDIGYILARNASRGPGMKLLLRAVHAAGRAASSPHKLVALFRLDPSTSTTP